MRRADFFMFNESKGILLNNWNSEPYFNYMLTNDGGKTWQQQRFKISRNDIRIMNTDEALNAVYSENGTVTVILKTLDSGYRSTAKVVVLESKDFGNTFKELH
jgi:predicted ribonuclease YlaK